GRARFDDLLAVEVICGDGGKARLLLHTFGRSRRNPRVWAASKVEFWASNGDMARRWARRASHWIDAKVERPRRLWVFVNPHGGKGRARDIWADKVAPIFKVAGISCSVVHTHRANHAHDLVSRASPEDLAKHDGIVVVGGDGLFQEVMNAILTRDSSQGPQSDGCTVRSPRIRLGHIPAGSTDAVAWSLNGSRSPVSAALRVALGDRMAMDVMCIKPEKGVPRFSACLAGYGFMGDVMSTSEQMRFLGPMRYDLAGVLVFLKGCRYAVKVRYLPATARPPDSQYVCWESCNWCTDSGRRMKGLKAPPLTFATPTDDPPDSAKRPLADASDAGAGRETFPADVDMEAATDGDKIKTIEGQFVSVMATVTSCRNDKAPRGVTPYAHLGDGRMHLVVVRRCSRLQYLKFLLSMAKRGVVQGKFPFVETVDAQGACFEPQGGCSSWNIDGEVVPSQRLTMEVRQRALDVFARGCAMSPRAH
ncbi:unnamed protein product, partial [Ostreobium quekettii]